jgi:hypothetical protein
MDEMEKKIEFEGGSHKVCGGRKNFLSQMV